MAITLASARRLYQATEERFGSLDLASRFALLSFALIAVAGFVAALALGQFVQTTVTRNVSSTQALGARPTLQSALTGLPLDRPLQDSDLEVFDRVVHAHLLTSSVAEVTLVSPDGLVVYSSDRALIGRSLPVSAAMRDALGGRIVTTGPDTVTTASSGQQSVLVTAAPLARQEGGPVEAVYLMSQRLAPLQAQIVSQQRSLWLALLAGLAALYLALYMIVFVSSRQLRAAHERLQELATHDSLTETLNRRALEERFEAEIARAQRLSTSVAFMMVDIDNMKLYNDTYGHLTGDAMLQFAARTLKAACRRSDVVGRYGGDEFALILPDASPEDVTVVAERIQSVLHRQPLRVPDGSTVPISLSIGIAVYPQDSGDPSELYSLADAVMYSAKSRGGGTYQRVTPALRMGSQATDTTLTALQELVATIDAKDHYTARHAEESARYALALADAMGFSPEDKRQLEIAGLLQDVGKIGIPSSILRKPGPLSGSEREAMRRHPILGHLIIQQLPHLDRVLEAVLHHHERFDGKGYPRGLRGEEIPIFDRILAISDAYTAMTADRPYRKALTPDEAVAELRRNAGSQFDPRLVEMFMVLRQKRLASLPEAVPQHSTYQAAAEAPHPLVPTTPPATEAQPRSPG